MIHSGHALTHLHIQSVIVSTRLIITKSTFVYVLGNVFMNSHTILLVECNLVGVEDVQSTSYGTEIAGKDVGLGKVIVGVGGGD